jgi:hypothetical protein
LTPPKRVGQPRVEFVSRLMSAAVADRVDEDQLSARRASPLSARIDVVLAAVIAARPIG